MVIVANFALRFAWTLTLLSNPRSLSPIHTSGSTVSGTLTENVWSSFLTHIAPLLAMAEILRVHTIHTIHTVPTIYTIYTRYTLYTLYIYTLYTLYTLYSVWYGVFSGLSMSSYAVCGTMRQSIKTKKSSSCWSHRRYTWYTHYTHYIYYIHYTHYTHYR